jgi:3-dehydroquinate synthase
MLEEDELRRIFTLLGDLGLPLNHPALATLNVDTALGEFREHLGGKLAITLLTGIGQKQEVDRIDTALMECCVDELLLRDNNSVIGADHPGTPSLMSGVSS